MERCIWYPIYPDTPNVWGRLRPKTVRLFKEMDEQKCTEKHSTPESEQNVEPTYWDKIVHKIQHREDVSPSG